MSALFCVIFLVAVTLIYAEPSTFPTLGPSESPAPSPSYSSRVLRGKSKYSKGKSSKGKGHAKVNSISDEIGGQVQSPSTSANPAPAASSSKAPSEAGEAEPFPTLTSTLPPSSPPIQQVEITATPTALQSSLEAQTLSPSSIPTLEPSVLPSSSLPPSALPTLESLTSSSFPKQTELPSDSPSLGSSDSPSLGPSALPTLTLSSEPTDVPSELLIAAGEEPTDVPSELPIATGEEYCNLVATVDCRLKDGAPCTTLSRAPVGDTGCKSRPYELEWLYKAGSCNQSSTTSRSFECRDENGGPSSLFMAYLTITGVESNEVYVSKSIFQGIDGFPVQSVVLTSGADSPSNVLDEAVSVVISKGSPSGEILQEMTFSIACDESDSLNVGDTFGALQLASYLTNVTSSMQAYADITWIYSATNTGNASSVLESMVSGSSGTSTTVSPGVELSPGEEYHVVAHETISLIHSATFTGELTMLESNAMDECSQTSSYIFAI